MYSNRSALRTVSAVAALLLAGCRVETAADNATAEVTVPEPAVNAIADAGAASNSANAVAPNAALATAARYRFTGTEPFWGGTINGATILYQTPEDQAGTSIAATIAKAGPATLYSGTLAGRPFVLTLAPGTCSDGMSETVYPLTAALTVAGEQRQGCASPIVGDGAR